jgi:hypothetical protein
MGTSPAAYFALNVHVSATMRAMIAAPDWLHVIRPPAYAPDLNLTEAVWSHLERSIGNLAVHGVNHLQAIIKNRLKRIQYRTDLLDSFLAHTGPTLDSTQPFKICSPGGSVGPRTSPPRRGHHRSRAGRRLFVDDFIVRMTLVPAVLQLLGRSAWWLPQRLQRFLPNVDIEGANLTAPAGPEPAREPGRRRHRGAPRR